MKYKTYRICLLSLVILAVVGGIFYYRNVEQNQLQAVDGTFVEALPAEGYMTALDAFCRKVAGWEDYADGEAYGGR